jgi:hypothetical protein
MTTRTSRTALAYSRTLKLTGVGDDEPVDASIPTDAATPGSPSRNASREVATFLHIQRNGVSQVVTVIAGELELLFHDGVLMPIDSVGKRHVSIGGRDPS